MVASRSAADTLLPGHRRRFLRTQVERSAGPRKLFPVSLPYKEPNRTRTSAENAEKSKKIRVNPRPSAFSASYFLKCTVVNFLFYFDFQQGLREWRVLGRTLSLEIKK
jgi:hypothetical protein